MSNAIQVFSFEAVEVRVVIVDGEPWWIAKDVCGILGLTNPTEALKALDDDEKMTLRNSEGHSGQRGGAQFMNIISESGLYALIMRSNKPEARRFRKWVTGTVLPQIRKTGSYNAAPDKERRRGLVEMRLEVQKRNVDVEAARTLQRMIENPVYPLTDEDKEEATRQIVILTTGHDFLKKSTAPKVVYYTAQEIGKEVGISDSRVMKIARCHWLIAKEGHSNEHGKWTRDAHNLAQWLFTEEGRQRTVEAIQDTARRLAECARGYGVMDYDYFKDTANL